MINIFDVITLIMFVLPICFGLRNGFFRMTLKVGAVILAGFLSKTLGHWIGEHWLSNLIMFPGNIDAELAAEVNAKLGIVVGVSVVFTVSFLLCNLFVRWISKRITKAMNSTWLDRLIGAAIGFAFAFIVMHIFGVLLHAFSVMLATQLPIEEFVLLMENSFIFKYFI